MMKKIPINDEKETPQKLNKPNKQIFLLIITKKGGRND